MSFAELGYHVEHGIFSDAECDELIAALAGTATRRRAGARHLMRDAAVVALARDGRLLTIARQALGRHAVPFRATLFQKSATANWLVAWHQDTALPQEQPFDATGWGPWSVKSGIDYAHAPAWALSRVLALRVHLDASTSENGPLRVVPGSHRLGVLSDELVAYHSRTNPHIDCVVSRGGALAMRPLLIHSSSKITSAEPRRVLHIEYAESLDIGSGMRLAIA